MNSKGIEPRVGMQFLNPSNGNPSNGIRRRIVGFTSTGEVVCNGCIGCCGDYECTCTCLGLWNNGHYKIEWIPPTDEERAMFRKAAEHISTMSGACSEFCRWLEEETDRWAWQLEIAESLSMDGM